MKRILTTIIFIVVLVILNANDINYKIPQVLIIQSYHSGFLWTDNVNNGIKSTLKQYDSNIRIRTEFLDTKRFTSPQFKENLKMMLKYKYEDSTFDVVIVADNNAFEMVKELRDTVFEDTPIVFCGLNYFEPSQLGDMKNVTGVREKIVSLENFELIKKIHKNVEKIIVINEMTPTGELNKINIMADIRDFKEDIDIEIVDDISVADLKEKLRNLSPNTVVLYSLFFKDNEGRFLEYDESIMLVTESANVPVYVSIDFSLGYGAVGGFLTSGTLQGENAADLAIKILQGAKADKLDIIDISPNTYYFDYKVLQKWGIKLSDLPDHSKLINYQESYLSRNKKLIVRFSLIVLILSAIIFWLIITLIKKNRLKNDLLESNESLTNLKENLEIIVKDRTNELEDERNFITAVQDYEESLVIVFDKAGVINRANRCAISTLEFDANTITGQELWQNIELESDIETIKRCIENNDVSKDNLSIQLRLISNNGKKLIVDCVFTNITTKGIKYFILTGTNVTEKYYLFKRLESEEKKYRSVYDNSGIAMITVTENNLVTMVNNKFEELSGYTKEEIVNKMTWQNFVEESEINKMLNNRELRYQNKLPISDNYEIKLVNKKGFVLDVLLNVVVVPETREVISSLTDITARNIIQNKIKHLLEEQKAFNDAKNNFYKNFGQDLNTPINSIHGIIDLVKNSADKSDIDDYLKMLQDLSRQLLYIVSEMTNFQLEIESKDLNLVKCNLSEFITYTAKTLIEGSNITDIYFSVDESLESIQYLALDKLKKLMEILIIKLAKESPSKPLLIDIISDEENYLKFILHKQESLPKNRKYVKVEGEKKQNILNLEYLSEFRFNYLIMSKLVSLLDGKIEYNNASSSSLKYEFKIKKFTKADESTETLDSETENNIHKFILPNDVWTYRQNNIDNIYPLKVLIVNYSNISHFVLYKVLENLNQKIDICTPEEDLKEIINKTTYDVIFFDFTFMSINNLNTLKEIRLLKNIYQPFVIAVNLQIDKLDSDEGKNTLGLIDSEMPELLSISNIALIIQEATEYKNKNI